MRTRYVGRLIALFSAALFAVLGYGLSASMARASVPLAAHAYDAASNTLESTLGAGLSGATSSASPVSPSAVEVSSVPEVFVAADTASDALSYSAKITKQIGPRGWTKDSISETINNPETTHPVWDYTTGDKLPATAYVQRGGGYVVVNDSTGEIVQVSDLTNPNWKPVWDDPRFQR